MGPEEEQQQLVDVLPQSLVMQVLRLARPTLRRLLRLQCQHRQR